MRASGLLAVLLLLSAAVALVVRAQSCPAAVDVEDGAQTKYPAFKLQHEADRQTIAVGSAGDLNHDSILDLFVATASRRDPAQPDARVHVVYGQAADSGFDFAAPLHLSRTSVGLGFGVNVDVDGNYNASSSGEGRWRAFSVATVDDTDHDGEHELLLGVPAADDGRGAAYVIYAYPEAAVVQAGDQDATRLYSLDLLHGTGEALFKIQGEDREFPESGSAASDFGFSVSAAGDLNSDQRPDFIAGAPYQSHLDVGRAYAFFGSPEDEEEDPWTVVSHTVYAADAGELDGQNGFLVEGKAYSAAASEEQHGQRQSRGGFWEGESHTGDRAGWSVRGVGDISGDGMHDVVIGIPFARDDEPVEDGGGGTDHEEGAVLLVFGKDPRRTPSNSHGPISPEVYKTYNFLERYGLFRAELASGRTARLVMGGEAGSGAGHAVAPAGDVNGDGVQDIVVGAPYADHAGAVDAGAAYVLYGRAVGFYDTYRTGTGGGGHDDDDMEFLEDNPFYDFDLQWDLPSLANGVHGFVVRGDADHMRLGWSVSSAGDVNGDGYDDVVVGAAHGCDPSSAGEAASAAYVIFGGPSPDLYWMEQHDLTTDPRYAGLTGALSVSELDGTNGFVVRSAAAAAQTCVGLSVAAVGDVGSDAAADFIVSANSANDTADAAAYVVMGDATTAASASALAVHQMRVVQHRALLIRKDEHLAIVDSSSLCSDHADDVVIFARDVTRGYFGVFRPEGYLQRVRYFSMQQVADRQVFFQHGSSAQAPVIGLSLGAFGQVVYANVSFVQVSSDPDNDKGGDDHAQYIALGVVLGVAVVLLVGAAAVAAGAFVVLKVMERRKRLRGELDYRYVQAL